MLELFLPLFDILVGELEVDLVCLLGLPINEIKVTITSNSPCKLHVLLIDCLALGVNTAEISVFEKTHDVSFCGLLKGDKSCRLEAEIGTTYV